MRRLLGLIATLAWSVAVAADGGFSASPAEQIPLYYEAALRCVVDSDGPHPSIACKDPAGKDVLGEKSLRELAMMRNTVFARYGWDGYRKPWLRDYFHSQAWFKPNPKFSYKLLSAADKKNVHFIATRENSFSDSDLHQRENAVYAAHGKLWKDKPTWQLPNGKKIESCDTVESAELVSGDLDSHDCFFASQKGFKPNPKYTDDLLTAEDRIELGLISRALGSFAIDGEKLDKTSESLDRILPVADLRQLSLRDLRYLRNTIYARRGRAFKSKVLQEHFQELAWYKVDAQYTDAKLNPTDNRNVKLIRSVEDEFGGPLQDEDWLIDPATDGA